MYLKYDFAFKWKFNKKRNKKLQKKFIFSEKTKEKKAFGDFFDVRIVFKMNSFSFAIIFMIIINRIFILLLIFYSKNYP